MVKEKLLCCNFTVFYVYWTICFFFSRHFQGCQMHLAIQNTIFKYLVYVFSNPCSLCILLLNLIICFLVFFYIAGILNVLSPEHKNTTEFWDHQHPGIYTSNSELNKISADLQYKHHNNGNSGDYHLSFTSFQPKKRTNKCLRKKVSLKMQYWTITFTFRLYSHTHCLLHNNLYFCKMLSNTVAKIRTVNYHLV